MGLPIDIPKVVPNRLDFYDATSGILLPLTVGDGLVQFGGAGTIIKVPAGIFRVTVRCAAALSATTAGFHLGIAFGYGAAPASGDDASTSPNYTTGQSETGMATGLWRNSVDDLVVASVSVVIEATGPCWIDYVAGNELTGGPQNVSVSPLQIEVEYPASSTTTSRFTSNVN